MEDLKLELDEGIILQTTDVERYQKNDNYIEVYELYLTNKNLISVYEKSNGMFKKTETIVEKIPLTDIKVVNGKVQIFKKDDNDYGLGLQILFTNGAREHFVFCKSKKELQIWMDNIIETITGEKIINNETKKESEVVGVAGVSIISGFKKAVDSAKEVMGDIKSQVMDEFNGNKPPKTEIKKEIDEVTETKKNYEENDMTDKKDYIYCSNCGEKLSAKSKFCNSCGEATNNKTQNKKDVEQPEEEKEQKKASKEEITERKTVFDGKIHKCPNCGEVLKSFMTNCPACGFELSRKEVTESLKEFIEKINECEEEITNSSHNKTGWASWSKSKRVWWVILNICFVCIPLVIYFVMPLVLINKKPRLSKEEKQMSNLIENFPFPNDRESILAALVFAKEKVNFLSNENVDRKSAYWLKLWNTKAEQLKQKADMLFPNDPIVRKSYNDIINDGNKVNKILKTKAIVGIVILIFAIIFLVVRYNVFDNVGITNPKDYNATFEWQTNGLFEKLPEPETNNGKIVSEIEKQIQIELYNISPDDFDEYVKRCRESGFSYDVTKNDSVFYSKDVNGYDLSIFYDEKEKVMKIYLDSYDTNTNQTIKNEQASNSNNEQKNEQVNESKNEEKNEENTSVSFGNDIVANSNEYIKIKEVGYTMVGDYLTCIVTIKNSNSKKAIEFPSFRVTAYSEDGKILGSEERVLNVLYPNQEMVDQGTLIEVSGDPHKIEITALEPDEDDVVSVSDLEYPVYKDMKCQNLSVTSDKITGEVYNPNNYKIESAMITVVFRDSKNKIISSESAFVDDIPANGKIPFDISLASDAKTTDKIEAFAYLW